MQTAICKISKIQNYTYGYKYFFKFFSIFTVSQLQLLMDAVIKIHYSSLKTTPTKSHMITSVIQGVFLVPFLSILIRL